MNLKEHNNNTYTKEKNNIEKYLLRIIQRYFDIENNYTQESIEAIIVQSLTRFKRDVLKEKGYIFSFNQMTGNITLTIQDFGGEYKFDKNNAFNKDFGIDADTICEGNDTRLSDKRKPNKHVHIIDNVIGLKELLESFNIITGTHIHNNKNILDMLKYSGSLAEFDLQLLEVLCEKISKYYPNLEFQKTELSKYSKKQIEILDEYILTIIQDLENAKLFIIESINQLNSIYKYITDNTNRFRKEQIDKLSNYIEKAQVSALIEYFKKVYFIVYENEINIQNGEILLTPIQEEYQDIDTTDNSSSYELEYPYGHTDINEKKEIHETVPSSILNKISNNKIKMFFRYTKDEKEYQYPLPYYFEDSEGRDIIIQGNYDNDGNIDIQVNFINTVPLYCSNLYNDTIIAITDSIKDSAINVRNNYKNTNFIKVSKIDSLQKEQFIRQLILNKEQQYLIQGICISEDGTNCIYQDYNNNNLSYVNFTDIPSVDDLGIFERLICYTYDDKMKILNDNSETIPIILEYRIPRITEYFENPRIYYQVLGNKEGM